MITHPDMVRSLVKPGADIIASLTPRKVAAWHMSSGVGGEAGEVVDLIKKWVIYGKPFDEKMRAKIVEEMGDLEFYLEGLRQDLEITREEVLAGNIEKLGTRYANFKYSDAAAQARVDQAAQP
jgi:NTP pyrophosphatase (non-canonical NTP hydrolase)